MHTKPYMINMLTESFLALYKVQVSSENNIRGTNGQILEDSGSTDNLIVHAFEEVLKLPSEPITASIKVPGEGYKACQLPRFQFQMEYMTEKSTHNTIGVDNINKTPQAQVLAQWFPGLVAQQNKPLKGHTGR